MDDVCRSRRIRCTRSVMRAIMVSRSVSVFNAVHASHKTDVSELVTGSYTVFFVSLIAHAAQFAFLLWFENPHIERIYGGGKKPLAGMPTSKSDEVSGHAESATGGHSQDRTPSVTDGKLSKLKHMHDLASMLKIDIQAKPTMSGIETQILTLLFKRLSHKLLDLRASRSSPPGLPCENFRCNTSSDRPSSFPTLTSSGELHFLILRGNTVLTVFSSNRATDFTFTLLVGYAVLPAMFSPVVITRPRLSLAFYFLHALAWRMFHSFGLGFLLKVQSEERWLVRHFLKHYHYPAVQRSSSSKQSKSNSTDLAPGDEAGEDASDDIPAATRDAFDNWKVLYNTSLVMTYG